MTAFRRHFSNSREILAWYDTLPENRSQYNFHHGLGAEGAKTLRDGTDRFNDEIKKIADVIWENVPVLRRSWQLSIAGAFPQVPAFLAGEPDNMYRMQEDYSEHTPIRIWIGTTSSIGITEEQLVKRGAALSAFAQALSEIRPVFLTPYTTYGEASGGRGSSNGDMIVSWDLQTSPIIMSEVAASLCDPNVVRHLTLDMTYRVQPRYSGQWTQGFNDEKIMRAKLGAEPQDLWLKPIYLYDELLTDPIKWVKENLKKYIDDVDK